MNDENLGVFIIIALVFVAVIVIGLFVRLIGTAIAFAIEAFSGELGWIGVVIAIISLITIICPLLEEYIDKR